MNKIGIMGGTFDPIHNGHLILAQRAYESLHLDLVLFIPAGSPPHKQNRRSGSLQEDRMRMTELAIGGIPYFSLSGCEMNREGPSYTWQTLEELKEVYPDAELYFLMGADSLEQFSTWRRPERIASLAVLTVAARGDAERDRLKAIAADVSGRYQADIRILDTPLIDISSTELREAVKEGRSIRFYVPDAVETYIREQGLYRDAEDADEL